MTTTSPSATAVDAPTQFAESNGRHWPIARSATASPSSCATGSAGSSIPGTRRFSTAWPARSTSSRSTTAAWADQPVTPRTTRGRSAKDANDLADALGLDTIIIGGWSLGGLAAQTLAAVHSSRVSHAVLIGTGPPGRRDPSARTALLRDGAQAGKRPGGRDHPVLRAALRAEPQGGAAVARSHCRAHARPQRADSARGLHAVVDGERRSRHLSRPLAGARLPVVDHHAGAGDLGRSRHRVPDRELVCARSRRCRRPRSSRLPRAGHGPQHEFPSAVADYIATFVRTTR